MTAMYMIPVRLNMRHLPLEYVVFEHKVDRRTRFERFNANRKIASLEVVYDMCDRYGFTVLRAAAHIGDESTERIRIIAPDGKAACNFLRELQKQFPQFQCRV